MAKKSTQISNRNANADHVISSVHTHGGQIARALHARAAALPEEEQLGEEAIAAFLRWLGANLRYRNQALAAAEMAYVEEQADDPALRAGRDLHVEALLTVAGRVRARIETVLGGQGLATYGMSGVTPRIPAALVEHVGVAIQLLRGRPQQADDGIGGVVDTARLADVLEAALAPVRQSMAVLTQERRELDAALLERNQALATWLDAYQGVAGALTALYRLAGYPELAQRVRPTARRSAGEELPAPVGEEPGDALPPADAPDAPGAPGAPADAPAAEQPA